MRRINALKSPNTNFEKTDIAEIDVRALENIDNKFTLYIYGHETSSDTDKMNVVEVPWNDPTVQRHLDRSNRLISISITLTPLTVDFTQDFVSITISSGIPDYIQEGVDPFPVRDVTQTDLKRESLKNDLGMLYLLDQRDLKASVDGTIGQRTIVETQEDRAVTEAELAYSISAAEFPSNPKRFQLVSLNTTNFVGLGERIAFTRGTPPNGFILTSGSYSGQYGPAVPATSSFKYVRAVGNPTNFLVESSTTPGSAYAIEQASNSAQTMALIIAGTHDLITVNAIQPNWNPYRTDALADSIYVKFTWGPPSDDIGPLVTQHGDVKGASFVASENEAIRTLQATLINANDDNDIPLHDADSLIPNQTYTMYSWGIVLHGVHGLAPLHISDILFENSEHNVVHLKYDEDAWDGTNLASAYVEVASEYTHTGGVESKTPGLYSFQDGGQWKELSLVVDNSDINPDPTKESTTEAASRQAIAKAIAQNTGTTTLEGLTNTPSSQGADGQYLTPQGGVYSWEDLPSQVSSDKIDVQNPASQSNILASSQKAVAEAIRDNQAGLDLSEKRVPEDEDYMILAKLTGRELQNLSPEIVYTLPTGSGNPQLDDIALAHTNDFIYINNDGDNRFEAFAVPEESGEMVSHQGSDIPYTLTGTIKSLAIRGNTLFVLADEVLETYSILDKTLDDTHTLSGINLGPLLGAHETTKAIAIYRDNLYILTKHTTSNEYKIYKILLTGSSIDLTTTFSTSSEIIGFEILDDGSFTYSINANNIHVLSLSDPTKQSIFTTPRPVAGLSNFDEDFIYKSGTSFYRLRVGVVSGSYGTSRTSLEDLVNVVEARVETDIVEKPTATEVKKQDKMLIERKNNDYRPVEAVSPPSLTGDFTNVRGMAFNLQYRDIYLLDANIVKAYRVPENGIGAAVHDVDRDINLGGQVNDWVGLELIDNYTKLVTIRTTGLLHVYDLATKALDTSHNLHLTNVPTTCDDLSLSDGQLYIVADQKIHKIAEDGSGGLKQDYITLERNDNSGIWVNQEGIAYVDNPSTEAEVWDTKKRIQLESVRAFGLRTCADETRLYGYRTPGVIGVYQLVLQGQKGLLNASINELIPTFSLFSPEEVEHTVVDIQVKTDEVKLIQHNKDITRLAVAAAEDNNLRHVANLGYRGVFGRPGPSSSSYTSVGHNATGAEAFFPTKSRLLVAKFHVNSTDEHRIEVHYIGPKWPGGGTHNYNIVTGTPIGQSPILVPPSNGRVEHNFFDDDLEMENGYYAILIKNLENDITYQSFSHLHIFNSSVMDPMSVNSYYDVGSVVFNKFGIIYNGLGELSKINHHIAMELEYESIVEGREGGLIRKHINMAGSGYFGKPVASTTFTTGGNAVGLEKYLKHKAEFESIRFFTETAKKLKIEVHKIGATFDDSFVASDTTKMVSKDNEDSTGNTALATFAPNELVVPGKAYYSIVARNVDDGTGVGYYYLSGLPNSYNNDCLSPYSNIIYDIGSVIIKDNAVHYTAAGVRSEASHDIRCEIKYKVLVDGVEGSGVKKQALFGSTAYFGDPPPLGGESNVGTHPVAGWGLWFLTPVRLGKCRMLTVGENNIEFVVHRIGTVFPGSSTTAYAISDNNLVIKKDDTNSDSAIADVDFSEDVIILQPGFYFIGVKDKSDGPLHFRKVFTTTAINGNAAVSAGNVTLFDPGSLVLHSKGEHFNSNGVRSLASDDSFIQGHLEYEVLAAGSKGFVHPADMLVGEQVDKLIVRSEMSGRNIVFHHKDGTTSSVVAGSSQVVLTQAQYDAITPDPDTFYYIIG